MLTRPLILLLSFAFMIAPMSLSAQSWVPPLQMAEPGDEGVRVDEDGVLGNFLPAAGEDKKPAILLLGGSEGGLGQSSLNMARQFQAAGFSVLQLAYYRGPGQPEDFARVPLETFDKGLAWLAAQKGVDPDHIAIVGASKGAEAALIVGARHREIKAVVAGMPSSFVWPAFSFRGIEVPGASWTLDGTDLPSLPYGAFDPQLGLMSIYANGLKAADEHADAAISIEKMAAPTLLICGEEDNLWPACPMADMLKERNPDITVLAYPDAGHAVFGLPLPEDSAKLLLLAQLGGSAEGNNAARKDGWPKVLKFLKEALSGD